jgi:hypothetical protein
MSRLGEPSGGFVVDFVTCETTGVGFVLGAVAERRTVVGAT